MDQFAFSFTFCSITLSLARVTFDDNHHQHNAHSAPVVQEASMRDSKIGGTSPSKNEAPINPRALRRQQVLIGSSDFSQPSHTHHSQSETTVLFGLGCDGPVFREAQGKKRSWDNEDCNGIPISEAAPAPRSTKRVKRDLEEALPSRARTTQRAVGQSPKLRQRQLALALSSMPTRNLNIPRERIVRITAARLNAALTSSRNTNSFNPVN